ncbi:hypothetical protein GPECTOR_343g87 [Gonium pectorale]|uniref:Uncharacterized protein n=1 Tax=Gonium pectorale TaxID=33097 RepID=A0A150FVN1_GONPE|nr:hypothetical protein GPECTOR_343g87 [Gonium pectorale]|eukprot:KXZ41647.1 hypothetical protein GPECTOR_343g87 [Gonium pectorale]
MAEAVAAAALVPAAAQAAAAGAAAAAAVALAPVAAQAGNLPSATPFGLGQASFLDPAPPRPASQAWLITCGAVYLLLLRPRMFAEREEKRRHAEREAAEFERYEQDWGK